MDAPDPVDLVRSEERLRIGHEWVAVERVRIRRRVVTQEVLVPVTVRREELVVEQVPFADPLTVVDGERPAYQPPIVMTLHEEVPVVTVVRRPYERVTAVVRVARTWQAVTAQLGRERVEVEWTPEGQPDVDGAAFDG